MFSVLLIITIIVFLLLIIVSGIRPARTKLSHFELRRRSKSGDKSAQVMLEREQLLADVISLQRALTALLLVAMVILSGLAFGWLIGALAIVLVAVEYGALAHLAVIQRRSQKLYESCETSVLNLIKRFPRLFRLLRSVPGYGRVTDHGFDSRQELQHLIDQSGSILSSDERQLIVHGLSFDQQLVSSVMTPKSAIDSIKKSEFLGPLTLDELHKIGHSRLPVIDGNIDHVVGILHLQSLLALDIKRSVTAEKAMEPRVFYIRSDQTLLHSLAAFLRIHHHLFIVVNEFRETVGLLTLADVIEALFGRKLIDEFDAHDDLRKVATRSLDIKSYPEKPQDN